MAAHLRKVNVEEVVQLTGALTRPDVESSATELVRDVVRRVGARASVFYAPMIVSDPETTRALVRQPPVADAFARFGAVTKAVIGVGGWNPGTSTLSDALTESEREQMVRSRVRADLSGVLLDAGGYAIDSPLRDRIIAISAPELRRIDEVIGIAYGLDTDWTRSPPRSPPSAAATSTPSSPTPPSPRRSSAAHDHRSTRSPCAPFVTSLGLDPSLLACRRQRSFAGAAWHVSTGCLGARARRRRSQCAERVGGFLE
jgi:Putative sugar-binding domain